MTDTYAERLITDKFLELEDLQGVPSCYQYYQNNKESDEPLESFEAFMPEYPAGAKAEDEPEVPGEPKKPVLPDFTKDNPETGLPWTDEEIKAVKEQYEIDLEEYKAKCKEYKDAIALHNKWEKARAIIDSPLIRNLIEWFTETYPPYYDTDEGNEEDDKLFNAIKETSLTTKDRTVKIYNEEGEEEDFKLYPHVAFPNEDFERPKDDLGLNDYWYELYFIPAEPNQIELGTKGRSRWVGIMQINICLPKTWGTEELYARYDEVAKLFRSGLILEGVRIIRTYRSTSINDDDYFCLPVTIEWQADLYR